MLVVYKKNKKVLGENIFLVLFIHSLYETVKFTATYLKCVSALDFPLRAAGAGHWLLGRPKQL